MIQIARRRQLSLSPSSAACCCSAARIVPRVASAFSLVLHLTILLMLGPLGDTVTASSSVTAGSSLRAIRRSAIGSLGRTSEVR